VGLRDDPDTQIKHLGVGKQQLVEIAKALAKDVKLLILDEPTAALKDDSQHLLDLILSLKGKGITSIIISHKLNEIEQIADSITIIRDGRTIETLECDRRVDEDRIIRGMVGRSLESRFPDRTPHIGEVFFEVRDWTVRHPQIPERLVAKHSNLYVRRGEIVGIAGLMGAGRTELAMSLFGRSYGTYESGQILIDGKEVVDQGRPVRDRSRHGLRERGPQGARAQPARHDQALDRRREAEEDRAQRRHRPLRRERHRRRLPQEAAHQDARVDVGVSKLRRQPAEGRPGEVDVHRPELLILDEPTRGIDVGAKYEIYAIIQQLAAQGKGVILISSELPELLGISDRIYTIFEGQITDDLPVADATPENLMRSMTSARQKAQR
jgi:putative multiple sugar transport system ATP-binding protein